MVSLQKIIKLKTSPLIWIAVLSIILAGLAGWFTASVQSEYYEIAPYFYDAAAYDAYNARLAVRLEKESRLQLAWDEWLHNNRHPLRTVPLILFAPELLQKPTGHLFTALPMLAIFLGLSGWTIWLRTKSPLYVTGALIFICALPGLTNFQIGLSAYWLDLHTAFLTTAATLCLINAIDNERFTKYWLLGFSLLALAAFYSRFIAIVFLIFSCGPLFLYLAIRLKKSHSTYNYLALLGLPAAILFIGSLYPIVANFSSNLDYYGGPDFVSLRLPFQAVFQTNYGTLRRLLSTRFYPAFLGLVALINLFINARAFKHILPLLWVFVSNIFLIFILGSNQYLLVVYSALPLLLLCIIPFYRKSNYQSFIYAWEIVVLTGAIFLTLYRGNEILNYLDKQPVQSAKISYRALANVISQESYPVTFETMTQYEHMPLAIETYYQTGQLPLPIICFPVSSRWDLIFEGKTSEEIVHIILTKLNGEVNLLITPDVLPQEWENTQDLRQYVIYHVWSAIVNSHNWELVEYINSGESGRVAVYRNTKPIDAYNTYQRKLISPAMSGYLP